MLTGHNYIVFLSGKYRGCDFPSHVLPPRNHHKPVCWCSMHRSGIPASFSCVPDVHSVFGYPAFSTGAVSAFSFPVSSPASLDTRTRSHLHGFLPHILRSHLQSFLPSSVFRRFVYVHLPCVCAEPCSLWNLRIRPSARYIRSFSLG